MKNYLLLSLVLIILAGCSQSPVAIEKAIAKTQTAMEMNTPQPPTVTPLPTLTPTRRLSMEENELNLNLNQELEEINNEIDSAIQEDAKYDGGLIKALIGVRLETLRTNRALVNQMLLALNSGVQVTIVYNSSDPDPEKVSKLTNDIKNQETIIAEARANAAQYSGGLIQAIYLEAVATGENTLIMLQQQYYLAKYGQITPVILTNIP